MNFSKMEWNVSFNLATILTETALATPDALVHLFGGTATTYRELDEQSGRFVAGLREAGLDPGDVVALQLPNLPPFLTAYFGALKAGMVVLPLNPLLMAPELEYHLGDSSATMLIGFEGAHAEAGKACERHRGARGLRHVRDGQHVLIQPARRPARAVHRQAGVGGHDAGG